MARKKFVLTKNNVLMSEEAFSRKSQSTGSVSVKSILLGGESHLTEQDASILQPIADHLKECGFRHEGSVLAIFIENARKQNAQAEFRKTTTGD